MTTPTAPMKKAGHLVQQVPAVVPASGEDSNMTTLQPAADNVDGLRIPALCYECGNQRTVSFRYAGPWGDRRLKCEVCGKTTGHAPVRPPGWDHREVSNRKASKDFVERERVMERMRDLGIIVRVGEVTGGGEWEARLYDDGVWLVAVNEELRISRHCAALVEAMHAVLTGDYDEAPEIVDGDRTFRGRHMPWSDR